ncbi:hypothetical protein ACVR1I_10850 [Streptococcus cameli]
MKLDSMISDFKSEKTTYDFKAIVHYAGAEVRETKDERVATQFNVLVSDRDRKGAVLVLKTDEKLELRKNTIYMVHAETKTRFPENHFGVTIYWADALKSIEPVAYYREEELSSKE